MAPSSRRDIPREHVVMAKPRRASHQVLKKAFDEAIADGHRHR